MMGEEEQGESAIGDWGLAQQEIERAKASEHWAVDRKLPTGKAMGLARRECSSTTNWFAQHSDGSNRLQMQRQDDWEKVVNGGSRYELL